MSAKQVHACACECVFGQCPQLEEHIVPGSGICVKDLLVTGCLCVRVCACVREFACVVNTCVCVCVRLYMCL